jgi:predicted dehydrogenase
MSAARPLRIGIMSTGRIARTFAQGVKPSKRVSVEAVASRDVTKAREFARSLDVPRALGSYEGLLADPDIDAIYNPLPNGLHVPWSRAALKAGKHVLCEKPLCASAAEARELFALAQARSLHVVEGFPYRAQPQTQKMMEILGAGTLGRIRLIQASFSFTLTQPNDVRLDRNLEGGALLDLGTYCVSLIRLIAGTMPSRVDATALWSEGGSEGGVDRTLAGTLEFKDGLQAQIFSSFDAALHRQALIVGEEGTLRTNFLNHTGPDTPGSLFLHRGRDSRAKDEELLNPALNGFLGEAESFAALIDGSGRWNGATPQESVDIAMTLEALLKSARSRAPAFL